MTRPIMKKDATIGAQIIKVFFHSRCRAILYGPADGEPNVHHAHLGMNKWRIGFPQTASQKKANQEI